MPRHQRPALVALLLACMPARAQAPPPPPSPRFAAILAAPGHLQATLDAARHSTTWIRHGCQHASITRAPLVAVWKQPEFDASGAPISGQWGERFQATGCGMTRTLNAETLVRSRGVLVSSPLAPGTTPADPTLQRDASRYAFAAAMTRLPGCRQAFLDDTGVVGEARPGDARSAAVARLEDWKIVACGQDITVEMGFRPSGTGTDILAHVR